MEKENKDLEENQEVDVEETSAVEENQEVENSEEKTEESKETQETEDASEEKTEKKKKKGFKRKDKRDEQIEELNDKYQRLFAEFQNFRSRSDKEKTAMFEVGAKSIIEKILPIIDSFERGLATVPEEEKGSGFAEGMDKVYKQLVTSLEEAGVKQIEALGQEFDPNLHNAVMHIEDESFGENVVAEEFQKGYMYRENVVRHSMVKVAN